MTVSSPENRIVYTGDGVTLAYSFPYYFFANSNLVVTKKLIASPYTETVLVLDTDYTVTGAGDPAGGTVTLVAVVAATYHLIIERIMPLTQTTDYVENDSMPAESLEASLDKLICIAQQLQAEIDTSILINLPTLVSGYLYNDGTTLSWSTITTTAYAAAINRGLDAAKAAVPSAGDLYIATDTGRFYICYVAGTWSNNIYLVDLAAKAVLVDNDLLLIEDSADSYVNKKITRANLKVDMSDACVKLTGNQTVNGIKTLGSFAITPSAAPTTDYQVANKKYVDDVLNSAGGYNSATANIDTAVGTPATLGTITLNTITGQKVLINAVVRPTQLAAANTITVFLYRDAVELLTYSYVTISSATHAIGCAIPMTYLDEAAGTAATTYTLKATNGGAGAQNATGYLSVLQVK